MVVHTWCGIGGVWSLFQVRRKSYRQGQESRKAGTKFRCSQTATPAQVWNYEQVHCYTEAKPFIPLFSLALL